MKIAGSNQGPCAFPGGSWLIGRRRRAWCAVVARFGPAALAPRAAVIRSILAVFALFAVASCSGRHSAPSPEPVELRVPLYRWVASLDPADARDIESYNVVRQLYEGLIGYDPSTLVATPLVAASYTGSRDGLVWRFPLRLEVRFIDDPCFPSGKGRALVAADVKYTIERILKRRGDGLHGDLPPLLGLDSFLAGRDDGIRGIEADSSGEVTIRLTRPDATLLYFLADPGCLIVPHEAVERYGSELVRHPVGTGPFRLVSSEPTSGILMARNPDYWRRDEAGNQLPYVDALFCRWDPGLDMRRLFVQGGLDVYESFGLPIGYSLTLARGDKTDGPFFESPQQYEVCYLNTIFLRFNFRSSHPLAHDRFLRAAVAAVCAGKGDTLATHTHRSAKGLFPPGLPGYDSTFAGQERDTTLARTFLRSAGYLRRASVPLIRIAWPSNHTLQEGEVVEALKRFGLQARFDLMAPSEFEQPVNLRNADLTRDGWMADYPDPQDFLQLFYSGSPLNTGHYESARFDAMFDSLRVEADPRARERLARRAERCLLDDVAAVFLVHETASCRVSPRVLNYSPYGTNPFNLRFYERIKLRSPAKP